MRVFTVAVAVLSITIGLACAAILWPSVRRGSPSVTALLSSAAVGATSAVVGGLVIGVAFGSVFAVAHWWYVLVVVAVPVTGIGVLVATATAPADARLRTWPVALGVSMLLPGMVGIHATHIAPHRLRTTSYEHVLPPDRSGEDPLRIAVLADIQTRAVGDHERAAIEAAVDADPDLIVVPGDVLQAPWDEAPAQIPELNEMFAELAEAAPTLVVSGDVDDDAELEAILAGTGAELLRNEVQQLEVAGHRLAVAGLTVVQGCGNPDHAPALDALGEVQDPTITKLVLTHRPDPVLCMEPGEADLLLAGHTHGGQIAVPLLGPLFTASDVPRSIGAGGLHEVNGVPVLVSRGIGMERNYAPQVRFGVPPEVVLVDLLAA